MATFPASQATVSRQSKVVVSDGRLSTENAIQPIAAQTSFIGCRDVRAGCIVSSIGFSFRPRVWPRRPAPHGTKQLNVDRLILHQQAGAEYILALQTNVLADAWGGKPGWLGASAPLQPRRDVLHRCRPGAFFRYLERVDDAASHQLWPELAEGFRFVEKVCARNLARDAEHRAVKPFRRIKLLDRLCELGVMVAVRRLQFARG